MRKSIESFSTGQFSSSLSAPSSVFPVFLDLFSIKLPKVDNVFVSSAVGVMEAGQGREGKEGEGITDPEANVEPAHLLLRYLIDSIRMVRRKF